MPHNPFSSCGVDGDPPSMTVCTQNYGKGPIRLGTTRESSPDRG